MTMPAAERLFELVANRGALIVGVGNRLRGDDGVGSYVAERLAPAFGARVIDAGTVPENFLGPMLQASTDDVVFVDAAAHGAAPGAWCLVPVERLGGGADSTHHASLRVLAEVLEERAVRSWMLGIQPAHLALLASLSPAVEQGAQDVIAALTAALTAGAPHA